MRPYNGRLHITKAKQPMGTTPAHGNRDRVAVMMIRCYYGQTNYRVAC